LEDQNDSVKIHAVTSSLDVVKVVEDASLVREHILPSFKTSCENRYSWRVRFAVAEQAAFLSSYLDKPTVDDQIVGFYELLLRDGEPEVRSEAVAKVPEVAKFSSSAVLIEKVLPILKEQMAKDQSQHVKGSMASAICELAAYITQEETIEYILPAVNQILQDSVTEVRVSLMQNIRQLAKAVGDELTR